MPSICQSAPLTTSWYGFRRPVWTKNENSRIGARLLATPSAIDTRPVVRQTGETAIPMRVSSKGHKSNWTSITAAIAAVASVVLALVMSLGGWQEVDKYRDIWLLIGTIGGIVLCVLGVKGALLWHRESRPHRTFQMPDDELNFRVAFHSQSDYVVNKTILGSVDLVAVHEAASAMFAERIVKFKEIVSWLSQGAPEPISGRQTVPRAATKTYRKVPKRDSMPPEQMAIQLIESEVFLRHA